MMSLFSSFSASCSISLDTCLSILSLTFRASVAFCKSDKFSFCRSDIELYKSLSDFTMLCFISSSSFNTLTIPLSSVEAFFLRRCFFTILSFLPTVATVSWVAISFCRNWASVIPLFLRYSSYFNFSDSFTILYWTDSIISSSAFNKLRPFARFSSMAFSILLISSFFCSSVNFFCFIIFFLASMSISFEALSIFNAFCLSNSFSFCVILRY